MNAGTSVNSRPSHSGATTRKTASRVSADAAKPNASPQPVMPASVSTRTNNVSICVHGPNVRIGFGSAVLIWHGDENGLDAGDLHVFLLASGPQGH